MALYKFRIIIIIIIIISGAKGRSRPLLVVCRSVNAAADVIASAKRLRHFADPVIKKNVFMNPNLTRAEAKAAYEVRCQRRQAALRRGDLQQRRNRDENTQSSSSLPPPSSSSSNAGSRLNAAANEWLPSSQQWKQSSLTVHSRQ